MLDIRVALGRKILCLAIIFNSIISMLLAGDILYIFYVNGLTWRPYSPYLLDGSFLWFVVIASFLNIVSAKILGNVELKRIKFHHYFYGFVASSISFIFIAIFAPAYLFTLLMPILISDTYSHAAMPISAAFLFVYGGMALMIDDIQDVSLRLKRALQSLKRRIQRFGRTLETFHLCCSVASTYVTVSIILWTFANGLYSGRSAFPGLSAGIFALNLLITCIWGLEMAKKRFWLKNLSVDLQRKKGSLSIRGK